MYLQEALSSPRVDNTVRMLQQENLSLVTHNARLEADVERLTEKLESIEGNFKDMVMYEKTKVRLRYRFLESHQLCIN